MAVDLTNKPDYTQVIKSVYNEEANALQITNGAPIIAPSGALEVAIDQTEDSIAIGDGTQLFTGTDVDSSHALDVNLVNTVPINVTITPLTGNAPATVGVNAVSAVAVLENTNRKGLIITNLTTTRVFLAFGANSAVVDSGIMLVNGGSYTMDQFTFSTQSIQAITSAGTSTLSIQEFQ